jgi:hypothetical protein
MRKCYYTELIYRALACLFMASATVTSAFAKDDLSDFVGMPSEKLVQTLGEPLLHKPDELWYSRKSRISNPWRNAPSVNISRGTSGVSVGNEYQVVEFADLPCEIVAKIDASDLIQSIEKIGPGCAEFVYLLRVQNSAKSNPR